MAVVKVYDQDKTEQGELTLTPEVFEVAVRPEILHLVVRAQLAAKRAGTHSTKTRAMVSGGGVRAPAALAPVPTVPPCGVAARSSSDPSPANTILR